MPDARRWFVPTRYSDMTWLPKLKKYRHFDGLSTPERLAQLASNPAAVSRHAFLPFLRFEKSWQPFRAKLPRPKRKSRTLRYAARRDAAILSWYRKVLSEAYELKLSAAGLEQCVIAYRRILSPTGGGKTNVHFALEAFQTIEQLRSCVVVALDISDFFGSIEHARLKAVWCDLLGTDRLPIDHFKVFEAITKFSDVSRDEALVKLGFAEWNSRGKGKVLRLLTPVKKIPHQLCTPKEFREKIAGKGGGRSIIEVNSAGVGVPQGAPISDLLANAYLLELDCVLHGYVLEQGGYYRRYSDDLLLILPGADESIVGSVEAMVSAELARLGDKISIKPSKTAAYRYFRDERGGLAFQKLRGRGRNGIEYLGMRFDGSRIFFRDGTLSALHRRIALAAKGAAYAHVARYPGKSLAELKRIFRFGKFLQRYGRVEGFGATTEVIDWTFWTYSRRAMKVLQGRHGAIEQQMQRYRQFARTRVDRHIDAAFYSRNKHM